MLTNDDVQKLYVAYYGRPADPAGLAFWLERFTASDNMDQVWIDFGTSIEHQNWLSGKDSEAIINGLYQQMFNRDANEEGLTFYSDLLDEGNAISIALDIANGAQGEDAVALSNKIGVAAIFTNRVAERNAWMVSTDEVELLYTGLLAPVDHTVETFLAGQAWAYALANGMPTASDTPIQIPESPCDVLPCDLFFEDIPDYLWV